MNKDDIIKELKKITKERGKSPTRRNTPLKLYYHSIKQFGYFNNAKKEAGLRLYNVRNELLKESYKIDKELVSLISFLTFDGYIYKSLKGLLLFSKNKKLLTHYEIFIRNKFGLDGNKRKRDGKIIKTMKFKIKAKDINKFIKEIGWYK